MSEHNGVSWACSILTTLTGLMSTNEVFQIVLTCLGILSAIISLAYNIYVWYKKATSDKKLSTKEVKDLKDILNKGIDEISKNIPKEDKKDE
ncbi:MAG: hypothetical protein SPJ07_01705 [Bacilli bacterium]|nr:hypothetical protein [Bacilli bacterium]